MSAGLPVIASAHGSPEEIVGEIGTEWLAAPGRADEWAARLANLDDAEALDVAGKRAREIYEAQYAPARGVGSLLDAYQRAIDNPREKRR
jgi:glycosyltransferase involved in cell wall biosynthesis